MTFETDNENTPHIEPFPSGYDQTHEWDKIYGDPADPCECDDPDFCEGYCHNCGGRINP